MSMSNMEYQGLKKRAGLHNWGFMPSKDELEEAIGFDLDAFDDETLDELQQDIFSQQEGQSILHENEHGEAYALQDYEE